MGDGAENVGERGPGAVAGDAPEWFYDDGTEPRGPFTLRAIGQMARAGVVGADVPVARDGADGWRPLSEVGAAQSGAPPILPTKSGLARKAAAVSLASLLAGLPAGATKAALGVAAAVTLIAGVNLVLPRDVMDTPFDRSSERAFQESYARFEKRATAEQNGRLVVASSAVCGLAFMRDQIPEDVMRQLCRGYWRVSGTVWETLGGHTPNQIIGFGEEVLRRANQPGGR